MEVERGGAKKQGMEKVPIGGFAELVEPAQDPVLAQLAELTKAVVRMQEDMGSMAARQDALATQEEMGEVAKASGEVNKMGIHSDEELAKISERPEALEKGGAGAIGADREERKGAKADDQLRVVHAHLIMVPGWYHHYRIFISS